MAQTFSQLVSRYTEREAVEDVLTLEASLSAIRAGAADPLGLIGYLQSLAVPVERPEDLLRINEIAGEEEVSAHAVADGVALAIASHGAWVLFRA